MMEPRDKAGDRRSLIYLVCVFTAILLVARHFKPEVYTAPPPEIHLQMGYMGLPSPPDCEHLYNVSKHRQWANCMGVQYK